MTDPLRERLIQTYRSNQGALASPALYADPRASWPYLETNYRPLVENLARTTRVLELGCGAGGMLGWLRSIGFANLAGVDASPGDVEFATHILGEGIVMSGDAFEYARAHPGAYDLVLMKALLEHVRKDELLESVSAAAAALASDGRLIVEVPNMGWLLAGHERYLDLTHEVGFTRESLASLLSLCFEDVEVGVSQLANPSRSQRLARATLVRIARRLLYILGEGADGVSFASRSLIAVARLPTERVP